MTPPRCDSRSYVQLLGARAMWHVLRVEEPRRFKTMCGIEEAIGGQAFSAHRPPRVCSRCTVAATKEGR